LKNEISIRRLERRDFEQAADLLLRQKRINGEFDSTFLTSDTAKDDVIKHLEAKVDRHNDHIALVAVMGEKIVGIICVDIVKRMYYLPDSEARITDFYVMPEFRRKNVARTMSNKLIEMLKNLHVKLVSAEFPSRNPMALAFYESLGFREMISIYGKIIEEK
jgi:ribosomal protein S18 acetylase RimI-like enzyme